jgi:hypothetical protein
MLVHLPWMKFKELVEFDRVKPVGPAAQERVADDAAGSSWQRM